MNKKLFVFDMDGTLLTHENQMLSVTVQALKDVKAQGHVLAVATGRTLFFIKKIKETAIFDYLICTNGTYYLNQNNGKTHIEHFVPEQIVDKMIAMAQINKAIIFLNDVNQSVAAIFNNKHYTNDEVLIQWGKITIVDIKDIFNYVSKSLITQASIFSTPENVETMRTEFMKNKHEIEIRVANKIYLDANPKNTSKYSAITKIAKELNISNDNIIAFGDSGNDIEMLHGVGLGIAMGNATDEAKAVANEIIGSNYSPAIAHKVLEIIKE